MNYILSMLSRRRCGIFVRAVSCVAAVSILALPSVELRGQAIQPLATGAVSVTSGRPLNSMADVLETRYGWIVTYEDAPLLNHQLDLVDDASPATVSAGRHSWSVKPRRVELPNGLDISPDAHELFDRILAAHQLADGAGRFTVSQSSDKVFHIVPTQARTEKGDWTPVRPLLDLAVSFPAQDRSVSDAIEQVCAGLSQASGSRVWMGVVPVGPFLTSRTQIGASGEPARRVLLRLLNEVGMPLTWRFNNIPMDGSWVLNVVPPGVTNYTPVTGKITPVQSR
jgi:hypothetical protein